MSPEEPSLSDHEQRILAEIERNLAAEDPDFVKQVSEAKPKKESARLLRFSILGLIVGLLLFFGYLESWILGVFGFVVMLAAIVGIATSVRGLASKGNSGKGFLSDWMRKAEDRMRNKPDDA